MSGRRVASSYRAENSGVAFDKSEGLPRATPRLNHRMSNLNLAVT